MAIVDALTVLAGGGVEGDGRPAGKRELTLLSREGWREACRELGADLPWHYRRANVLIEGIDLAAAIGRTIVIGPVRLFVHGETRPCQLMEQQHAGLLNALRPNCRAGVHGQVLGGGIVRIGDSVTLEPAGDGQGI